MSSFLFRLAVLLTSLIVTLPATAAPQKAYGRIEILRDTWGIPHVYSETDGGAMYGLGYSTAQEHGFQMTYNLRIIQGRLAELLGERSRTGRNETAVDHDRKMRTFGWERAAKRTAANLDRETQQFLQAYCEGINDSFVSQRKAGELHPLFEKYGIAPETWTPADCLLAWWHLAQFFATDGTRDLMTLRNKLDPPFGRPMPDEATLWTDDSTAVVQLQDADTYWVKEVQAFRRKHGFSRADGGQEGPKFSHAWVVGGSRSTTGSAVLVSDPQTPVRNPSLWIEFHVSGKTFNARGIGVPGSPGFLIGFNQHLAWGLTALGADQADLFLLETSPEHPDQYLWEGNWRDMEVRTERVKVKGGADVELKTRETHLGPVVSAYSFRQPGDPEVALKRVPLCEPDRDTIQGVFAMIRAQSAAQFTAALPAWRFPTANCLYGDSEGHIGYSVIGAIPIRSPQAFDRQGRYAIKATKSEHDWMGFLPHNLVPQVSDPKTGILFSGNHRPVASFYNIPLGLSTGSMGDTMRSWRLRERLSRDGKFTPQQVLDVHYDTVNSARRDMVRIGLHLRDSGQGGLSEDSLKALEVLQQWLRDGASSDLRQPGADLATKLSTFFRFVTTPLAMEYGGGESGLARYLKDAIARIEADKAGVLSKDEQEYIDTTLATAWSGQTGQRGGSSARPQARQTATPNRPILGWFDTLDGFGSLDRSQDLPSAPINVLDGQTIHSQASQSYTQYVPLHDPDSAQTICPIGHSDRPDSPYRTSTMTLWGEARLHPAPLSRSAVEKVTRNRQVLFE